MDCFKYQCEYRVILYRGVKSTEAYRLEIGDISDIAHFVKRNTLNFEIQNLFKKGIKQPSKLWYGYDRHELKRLFYRLGDYKAVRFGIYA